MKHQKPLGFTLLLATLGVGILIGTRFNTGLQAGLQNSTVAPGATPLAIPPSVPIANEFTRLTKRVEPSVVYIESDYLAKPGKSTRRGEPNEDEAPNQQDPSEAFRRFFGGQEQRSFRTEGSGTGFIVDKNGYLITNQHVVDNADRIKVRMLGDELE